MVQSIQNCARCAGDHEMVIFNRFKSAVVADTAVYEWWGSCPETGEPILCQVIYGDTELKGVHAPPQEN